MQNITWYTLQQITPWWAWTLVGLVLGLFVASVFTSIREAMLIRWIAKKVPNLKEGYTLSEWVQGMYAWLEKMERWHQDQFEAWKNGYREYVSSLEVKVAALTDERSRLREQLDRSHKRPRDAHGHFKKAGG